MTTEPESTNPDLPATQQRRSLATLWTLVGVTAVLVLVAVVALTTGSSDPESPDQARVAPSTTEAAAPTSETTTTAPAADDDTPDDTTAEPATASTLPTSTTVAEEPAVPEFVPDTSDGAPFLELSLEGKIAELLVRPNESFAQSVAGDMGLSGERRWAAWLLDLMRLGSANVNATATWSFERLSGIEAADDFSADFVTYGSWLRAERIDPGVGYPSWKRTLLAEIEDGYAALLAGLDENPDDRITLAAIQWGGVRRGGIPELNDPAKISVAQAADLDPEMTDDELVLGVVIGGEAVAYPLRFLARHELANDTVGGVPVALGYCTLCRTGLMFDRRVAGQVLTFQSSGLLMDSNKVMVDNETDSLWQHLSGAAFTGPLDGAVLETFPMVTTRWADWITQHPDTLTLDTPPPTFYPGSTPERQAIAYDYTPGSAYRTYYGPAELWFPTVPPPDFWDVHQAVITLTTNDGTAAALALEAVETAAPFTYTAGGELFVIVGNPGGARIYTAGNADTPASNLLTSTTNAATSNPADGATHTLGADAIAPNGITTNQLTLTDGTTLPRIVSGQSFWFAWWGLHPQTLTWPGPS